MRIGLPSFRRRSSLIQTSFVNWKRNFDHPESEYAQAERAFRDLDHQLDEAGTALQTAKEGNQTESIKQIELEMASLERQRKLAEARFDLAIEDRKTVREQLVTLRKKIKKDQAALKEATGEPVEETSEGEEGMPANEADEGKERDQGIDERKDRTSDEEDSRESDRMMTVSRRG